MFLSLLRQFEELPFVTGIRLTDKDEPSADSAWNRVVYAKNNVLVPWLTAGTRTNYMPGYLCICCRDADYQEATGKAGGLRVIWTPNNHFADDNSTVPETSNKGKPLSPSSWPPSAHLQGVASRPSAPAWGEGSRGGVMSLLAKAPPDLPPLNLVGATHARSPTPDSSLRPRQTCPLAGTRPTTRSRAQSTLSITTRRGQHGWTPGNRGRGRPARGVPPTNRVATAATKTRQRVRTRTPRRTGAVPSSI